MHRALDLQEPIALITRRTFAEQRTEASTRRGVAALGLAPGALLHCAGALHVFVQAPLARSPLQDFIRGAGERAVDARAEAAHELGTRAIHMHTRDPNGVVGGIVLGPPFRSRTHTGRAIIWQGRSWGQSPEVSTSAPSTDHLKGGGGLIPDIGGAP